ncbi:MAG: hypothetical protein H0W61_01050 [Bacteroidetes bacterium]|nr:hypothetical protein [Bacteroidota bacterium]
MKLNSFLLFAFTFFVNQSNAQAIRITVQEKTSTGVKPLADTKFELTLNDTIKTELTSGSDGMLGKVMLDPGTYRLTLANKAFEAPETKNIVVAEKKLTTLVITCTPAVAKKPEEKKSAPKKTSK